MGQILEYLVHMASEQTETETVQTEFKHVDEEYAFTQES